MLIGGMVFIITGLLILRLLIIKAVKMSQDVLMESENPTIKLWFFGFGAFWLFIGTGVHLIIANYSTVSNIGLGITFCIFVFVPFLFCIFVPFLFCIIEGFLDKHQE